MPLRTARTRGLAAAEATNVRPTQKVSSRIIVAMETVSWRQAAWWRATVAGRFVSFFGATLILTAIATLFHLRRVVATIGLVLAFVLFFLFAFVHFVVTLLERILPTELTPPLFAALYKAVSQSTLFFARSFFPGRCGS